MGLKVVAESVENEATMRRIAALGCEQAQGYHLSKRMPAAEVPAWLQSFKPRSYKDRRSGGRAFKDKQPA